MKTSVLSLVVSLFAAFAVNAQHCDCQQPLVQQIVQPVYSQSLVQQVIQPQYQQVQQVVAPIVQRVRVQQIQVQPQHVQQVQQIQVQRVQAVQHVQQVQQVQIQRVVQPVRQAVVVQPIVQQRAAINVNVRGGLFSPRANIIVR